MEWIKIKDLSPGTEIISVDEQPTHSRGKGRKMQTGIVEKIVKVNRQAYRIRFDDGRSVVCTGQHPWLTKKAGTDTRWRSIEFKKGLQGKINVGTKVRWITKPWENKQTYEDGWYGGMLDGEGSMRKSANNGKYKSSEVSCCQRYGDVWERMIKYVDDNNYHYGIDRDESIRKSKFGTQPIPKIRICRMDEVFKLLGKTRPSRFIKNRFWEGRELPGKRTGIGWSIVVGIDKLGEQEMIDLQTTTGTYIAEGFVSHNTTLEAIDMIDDCLWERNFNGLMISKEQEVATETFKEKVYYAWNNYQLKHLYNVDTDRANQLSFDFQDGTFSKISVQSSGRAGTWNRVHISELGYLSKKYPERTREILQGTIPSIPREGRIDIESTAEGEQGSFYEMFWEAWNRGDPTRPTEYKAHFYNWQWDDMSDVMVIPLAEMDVRFKEIKEKHNLTDIEISYYYDAWIALSKNWNALKQEYPITPEEAFVASGDKHFDMDSVEALKIYIKNGERVGDWVYYEEYQPGHRYALGADVSEGIGKDSSTICVMDFTPLKPKVVAEYHSNKIAPDLFAYECKNGGTRYGSCLVAVERNYYGHTTLVALKGMYHNIYTEEKMDKISNQTTTKLGWYTSAATKPKMMFELKEAINQQLIQVPSKWLIEEMRTYSQDDIAQIKFDEEQARHWDRLMAFAIAWQMKGQTTNEVSPEDVKLNYLDD